MQVTAPTQRHCSVQRCLEGCQPLRKLKDRLLCCKCSPAAGVLHVDTVMAIREQTLEYRTIYHRRQQ